MDGLTLTVWRHLRAQRLELKLGEDNLLLEHRRLRLELGDGVGSLLRRERSRSLRRLPSGERAVAFERQAAGDGAGGRGVRG